MTMIFFSACNTNKQNTCIFCNSLPFCLGFLQQTSCGSGQFLCRHDQRCINFHWTCDGNQDCSDGADEKLCAGDEGGATNTTQVSCCGVLNRSRHT